MEARWASLAEDGSAISAGTKYIACKIADEGGDTTNETLQVEQCATLLGIYDVVVPFGTDESNYDIQLKITSDTECCLEIQAGCENNCKAGMRFEQSSVKAMTRTISFDLDLSLFHLLEEVCIPNDTSSISDFSARLV